MSHLESLQRKAAIAKFIRENKGNIPLAMRHFAVSRTTVWTAINADFGNPYGSAALVRKRSERDREIERMSSAGLPYGAIAKATGVSLSQAWYVGRVGRGD